jgi:23S rRNA (pseudouridine1915-N3)-methyltransferase
VKAVLLRVGKGRSPWADAAALEYGRRLRRLELTEQLLEPTPFRGDVEAVRADEATRILAAIRPGDRLFCLDERGAALRTEDLAARVDAAARDAQRRVVFAIGGPYGHGPAVRAAAHTVLALSAMVLNHELARVLLVEQLYRVETILWGGSYHH